MKKKILSFALVISIMASMFVALPMTANAEMSGIYTYEVENGEVTITDCDRAASGDVKIPSTIEDCPVTKIGNDAFYYCENLTSIEIPDSVTSIGYGAFNECTSLTSIVIPDGVTIIDDFTFVGCTDLKSITIPRSVTKIDEMAFWRCNSLTDVYYGGTEEEWDAIDIYKEDKEDLMKATIHFIETEEPSIFTYEIENGKVTITGCDKSASGDIEIPSTIEDCPVTKIGQNSFRWCNEITGIVVPDSVKVIDNWAFGGCAKLKSITIPDSVTSIGFGVFECSEALESIILPESITAIDEYTFSGCTGLKEITIPDSVTSIGEGAFNDCDSLSDVYFTGTALEWYDVVIGTYNEDLTNATIHFLGTDEPAFTPGDISGEGTIDVRDVISLRRFIAGGYDITVNESAVDINKDGTVDVRDVITLRRFLAGGYGIEL